MFYISILSLILAAFTFLYVAWNDFRFWKIENRTVLILIALFIVHAASAKAADGILPLMVDPIFSFLAGTLLFIIGIVLWIFKMFGAGDAKLFFPIGLFLGWDFILSLSIGLIIFGALILIILRFPLPTSLSMTFTGMRIEEIRKTQKIPYGVVMALPTVYLLIVKYAPLWQKI